MGGAVVALVAGLGVAHGRDQPPGLIDASPQLAGHVEGALVPSDRVPIAVELSLALALGSYRNTVPPPSSTTDPDERIDFKRAGLGIVVEGYLPLGDVARLAAGAGGFVHRSELTAGALSAIVPIPVEYYRATDVSVGTELRGGADLRVHERAWLGLRAGWTWYRADFEQTGGGALGGPWAELRVVIESRALD